MKTNILRAHGILVIFVFALSACFKVDGAYDPSNTSSEEQGLNLSPSPERETTLSVASFDRVLENMISVTGISPSSDTQTVMSRNRSAFALNGASSELTSGMWMGLTALASSVCNDLYNKERALSDSQRVFYRGVSFTGGSFGSIRETLIQRLSLGFWGRTPSPAEVSEFQTALAEASLASTTLDESQTRDALLVLCTSSLSALSAQTF